MSFLASNVLAEKYGSAQLDLFRQSSSQSENEEYLSEQLITYIGNKRRLLSFIEAALLQSMDSLGSDTISFADVFAGTGVVSRLARRWSHTIYINDFERYSAFSNRVYHMNASEVDVGLIDHYRSKINYIANTQPHTGFITRLYSPEDEDHITCDDRVFYSKRNALFIDTARQEIDHIPNEIQPFLIAPLLQRASVHVNTSGVFKGFYKNKDGVGQYGGTMRNARQRILADIEIPMPVFSAFERNVFVSRLEAADFVNSLPEVDIAYFDPPYNQHPYGSNYFMLNLILDYSEPTEVSRVSGIPKNWQRSDFNVRNRAASAFRNILRECPAKVLLISYNSEGFIGTDEMLQMLTEIGSVTVLDQEYNTFRGCRNLSGRSKHVTEFLFKVERG